MTYHNVFVYGSLLDGLHNHHFLDRATLIGPAVIERGFRMVSLGGFPAIIPADDDEGTPIIGELYAAPAAVIRRLDRLEGHPTFYRRQQDDVVCKGADCTAWVYVLTSHGRGFDAGKYVTDGDWRAHCESRQDAAGRVERRAR
jgi:gamma-glutamylaminecyclotransferase